nr:MAG TPA: hypothetical protein [Caudoviricetes sp.]
MPDGITDRTVGEPYRFMIPPPGRLVKVYPCVWRWIL